MALNRWQASVVDLFTEVGRIEPLIRTRINASRPAGLDENRFIILNLLGRTRGLGETRSALGWSLDMLDGEFDGTLKQLVDAGLVSVDPAADDQDDRLNLTPQGEQAIETAVQSLSPDFEQLLSGISVETLEGAMETLREIRRTLDNLPDRMGDAA